VVKSGQEDKTPSKRAWVEPLLGILLTLLIVAMLLFI
jgi:hypothetical protein